MTKSNNINVQYNRIITQLQILNPSINLDEIKNDVAEFIYDLFIDEIENRDFSKNLSFEDIRINIIKQKLQSSRQPLKLRDMRYDKIKKEKTYFRLKTFQNSLKRKAFYDTLDYPGSFSKRELFYINHTDKTSMKEKLFDIEKNKNQKIIPRLKEVDKSTSYKEVNNFNKDDLKYDGEFSELQETIDIFKKFEKTEETPKKEVEKPIELGNELRNRILNLNLKPIKKADSEDIDLLDYIGFVDKDDNSQN